jgi:hypothetical protein
LAALRQPEDEVEGSLRSARGSGSLATRSRRASLAISTLRTSSGYYCRAFLTAPECISVVSKRTLCESSHSPASRVLRSRYAGNDPCRDRSPSAPRHCSHFGAKVHSDSGYRFHLAGRGSRHWPLLAKLLDAGERVLIDRTLNHQWAAFYPFTLVERGQITLGSLVASLALFQQLIGVCLLLIAVLYLAKTKTRTISVP